ncbi:MAG TPA: hypothetical protein VGL08_11270 [Paraburkholderia sp.]
MPASPANDPAFQRAGATSLYWSVDAGRVLGFFASPGSSGGERLSLSQAWNDSGGVFFFLGDPFTDSANDPAFAVALRDMLSWGGWPSRGQKLLWLAHASTTPFALVGTSVDTLGSGTTLSLRNGASFDFNAYLLGCARGMQMSLASGNATPGFVLNGACAFTTPAGPLAPVDGRITIPVTGAQAGCLCFSIVLPDGGAGGDLDQMGVGLRYAFPAEDGAAGYLHMPVLVQPAALSLYASLDPLRQRDPARTRLSFFSGAPDPGPGAMMSNFATARGHDVLLAPRFDGERPAGLVFAVQPLMDGAAGTVPVCHYLTLDGDFAISTNTPPSVLAALGDDMPIERLVCGASGLEYLGIPDEGEHRLVFMPSRNAYAPATLSTDPDQPLLTDAATTAWVYVRPGSGQTIDYYAQPDQATLYKASADAWLDFLEIPAATLPSPDGQRAFPVSAYRGLVASEAETAQALERRVLAPDRRRAIMRIVDPPASRATPGPTGDLPPVTADLFGVTPQGIAVGIDKATLQWAWLGIANMSAGPAATVPDLRFTRIQGDFKQAMQTNRLFMVMANDNVLMQAGSVAYLLTPQAIADIRADPQGVQPGTIDRVAAAMTGRPYESEGLFQAALNDAAPGISPADMLVFERAAGQLIAIIDGWRFQMSPRNWVNPRRDQRKHAFLIFKLAAGRSLAALVDDVSAWTWPEVATFGSDSATTRDEIQSIIADARAIYQRASDAGQSSPYAHFIERIVDDENWCGILSLSCDVPLESLPEPLQALAVGIDPARFYAHHVSFELTPFDAPGGALSFAQTAMSGLIDYDDPTDQFFEKDIEFAFKVLRLTIGFKGSKISSFSSRIELLANRLFGASARLWPTDRGNNLILEGTYQKQMGTDGKQQGTYLFSLAGPGTFRLDESALSSVEILSARLVIAQPADPARPKQPVRSFFQLGGNMRFWQPAGFDPFTYGPDKPSAPAQPSDAPLVLDEVSPGVFAMPVADSAPDEPRVTDDADATDGFLRFDNLAVDMSYIAATRVPSFALRTDKMSFDLDNSAARPNSLGNRFPVRLSTLVAAPNLAETGKPPAGQDPKDLGYVSVSCGLQQSKLVNPWYGIEYELKLGGLGALAAGAELTLKVLAAWSGGGTDDAPAVYVGVRLPGLKDAIGIELPIQQVLKLGFRNIEFHTYPAQPNDPTRLAYLMRFRNFGLQVLGYTFPSGHNDIYLFGNPDEANSTTLGWYAAYSADEDDKKNKASTAQQRRLAGRHRENN